MPRPVNQKSRLRLTHGLKNRFSKRESRLARQRQLFLEAPEALEARSLMAVVSLGAVTNVTEGFGYGSTIDGLGSAVNLNTSVSALTTNYNVNRSLDIAITRAFTQEFWFYPQSNLSGQLYNLGNLTTVSVANAGKDLQINGFANQLNVVLKNALNPSAWNHLAQTYDGNRFSVYANGIEIYTTTDLAGKSIDEPRTFAFSTSFRDTGVLDEVRIWNVARSQSQIQKGMTELPATNEPGLRGYWKFENDLKDSSPLGSDFFSGMPVSFVRNPAPQIGYVEVSVDQPVATGIGLFVNYDITGGTALESTDYTSSRFRTVSGDPTTEKRGIIIPEGETRGRIYFMARPDAISESTETVNIQLKPFTFATSSYTVGSASTATVSIADNGAYQPGLAAFASDGRQVSGDNSTGGTPLYLDTSTSFADIDFQLTSQPTAEISIQYTSDGNALFQTGAGNLSSVTLKFTPANWDQKQRVRLVTSSKASINGLITATGLTPYLSGPIKFNYSTIPGSNAKVTEGDSASVITPHVILEAVHNAKEGVGTGALIRADLDVPAPAGGLDLKYSYSITSNTSVSTFTGADTGEGLDLDGVFPYAVTMGGPNIGPIRSADFKASSVAGITFTAPNLATNYFLANFGSGLNDFHLAQAIESVRFTVNPNLLTVNLPGLTPGREYKLQLLFAEGGSNRGFDISVDGRKIVKDLNVGQVQGGATNRTKGVVVTQNFVASSTTAQIVLDGRSSPFPDRNPILNAFTLEQISTQIIQPLSGVLHVQPGARSVDLPIVVDDNDIVDPIGRTVAVNLLPGTGYLPGTTTTASVNIVDDDKPGVHLSNFTAVEVPPNVVEPSKDFSAPTDLGKVISGRTSTSGTISNSDEPEYFKFTVDRNLSIPDTVKLIPGAGVALNMRIFTMSWTQLSATAYGKGTQTLSLSSLAPGTYQLVISSNDDTSTPYSVEFHGVDSDVNDSIAAATDLGVAIPGTSIEGSIKTVTDQDFYKFTLDTRTSVIGSVVVFSDVVSSSTVTLYDAAGNAIDAVSAPEIAVGGCIYTISLGSSVRRGDGVYYLRVSGTSGQLSHNSISFMGTRPGSEAGVYTDSYAPAVLKKSATNPISQKVGLRLSSQPTDDVTLTLTSATSGNVEALSLSTRTVVFTPANWDIYQIVSLNPIEYTVATGTQVTTITANVASLDPIYAQRVLKFDAFVEDDKAFEQPADTRTPQNPNLPKAYISGASTRVNETVGGSQTSFQVNLTQNVTAPTYVGISFDTTSAVLGKDFKVQNGLVQDYKLTSNGATKVLTTDNENAMTFVDINGDKLLDLFIGSATGPLRFYKNVGTPTNPTYVDRTGSVDDPFALFATASMGGNLHPAFIDADGNGTPDLLLGSRTGMTFFRNIGTAQSPKFTIVAATAADNPFSDAIGMGGSYFAPVFADLYGLGRLDLFVARQGSYSIAYFQRGTTKYLRNDTFSPLANITVPISETPTLAFADLTGDGILDALVGLSSGTFARLNAGSKTAPIFNGTGLPRIDQVLSGVKRASWAVADLNGSGLSQLYSGNVGKSLFAYQSYLATVIPTGSSSSTIQLAIPDNLVDEGGDRTINIRLLEANEYILNQSLLSSGKVADTITIANNDVAGIIVTPPADTTVKESGTTQATGIRLSTQPVSPVTVFVTSSDPNLGLLSIGSQAGVAAATFTFTPTNWNVQQFYSVIGLEDEIDDGNRAITVSATSSSDDVPYRSLKAIPVTFTHINNDTFGIAVTGPQATLQGKANVFSLYLKSQPTAEVRITMTPIDDQIAIDGNHPGDPVTVVFNSNNWNVPQFVQVTAADDGIVEYFHTSQIRFSVDTARRIEGRTSGVYNSVAQALDLGEMNQDLTWTNLPLDTTLSPGSWFKFSLSRPGAERDYFQADANPNDSQSVPQVDIFDSTGSKLVVANQSLPTFVTGRPAASRASLKGLAAGTYLVRLTGIYQSTTGFTFTFNNSDRLFESVALSPITVSIKDNDQPTAQINPGPSAAEIGGQPSYFAVKLNAPAPAAPGDVGIKVNFKVTGGRAILGDANSLKNDYGINADFFDINTQTGWVRVAPGDLQANIGVVPVDNKVVEDLPVSLRNFGSDGAGGNQVRVSVLATDLDANLTSYTLRQNQVILAHLSDGRDIPLKVTRNTDLVKSGTEFFAIVPVSASEGDAAKASELGSTTFKGRVESKDVEITLLPGDGYLLPLALDKQNLDATSKTVQAIPANLDQARTVARLSIADDDLPGFRIVRVGDDTPIPEGNLATYAVSLLAEPTKPVTVTLTPQGNLSFVSPTTPAQGSFAPTVYRVDQSTVPSNLEIRLNTLVSTDKGWTASIDARVRTTTYGATSRVIPLSVADSKLAVPSSAGFQVPATTDVDAAGQPLQGNWHEFQNLIIYNLTSHSDVRGQYFELTLKFDSKPDVKIRINATAGADLKPTTTSITFTPDNWFKFQNVQVKAEPDAVAEPGSWYQAGIAGATSSLDSRWNQLTVPNLNVHLSDTQLVSGEVAEAITSGFDTLENSLSALKLPLVGNITEFAPQITNIFSVIEDPLVRSMKSSTNVSASSLEVMAESSLEAQTNTGDPASGAYFDFVTVTPSADSDQVSLLIELKKTWNLGGLNLDSDLGLDALGLSITTEGSINAKITLSISFAFGLSRKFGFFIDTKQTGIDASASLSLDGFKATGHLGFLQLDLENDDENPTALAVAFHAGLNDLDNYQTVRFLDANGDGMLANQAFSYPVGVDSDKNSQIDLNTDGTPKTVVRSVLEPFQNLSPLGAPVDTFGTPANFPTVGSLTSTALAPSQGLNFNGNNTFDEAVSTPNEGVYRVQRQGALTIFYFDSNNNGKLDLGRRGLNPFTTPWSSLTQAEKDKSDIWVSSTTTRWQDTASRVKEFQIQTRGSGTTLGYFFDANGDNRLDDNEQLSLKLRNKLDKNKDGRLLASVQKDGEGVMTQGMGVAFDDLNNNGRLDFDEPFVNSMFGSLEFDQDALTTADGVTFLDFGGDGHYTLASGNIPADVQLQITPDGVSYIDLNNNGFDILDPQSADGGPLTVPAQSLGGNSLIVTYAILGTGAARYFDVDGDKSLTSGTDILLDQTSFLFNGSSPTNFFGIPSYATSFTFHDTDGDRRLGKSDFQVLVSEATQFLDLNRDGTLTDLIEPTAEQNNEFDVSGFRTGAKVVKLLNDGDRLTLRELTNFVKDVRASNTTKKDQLKSSLELFEYSFVGGANLGMSAVTSVDGNPAFPSLSFDLAVNFPLFNLGNQKEAGETGFSVDFNQVTLDLGSFLTSFAAPVMNTVDKLLTPIKPIIAVLNTDTELPGAIGLASFFESDGRPGTSLLEIAQKLAGGNDPKIKAAIKFANVLTSVVDTVGSLNAALADTDSFKINFGDFSMSDLRAASDDVADVAGKSRRAARNDGQTATTANSRSTDGSLQTLNQSTGAAAQTAAVANAKSKSNAFSKLSKLDGFELSLFNPDTIMSLLLGETGVDLIKYDIPDFSFDFNVSKTFPIYGPIRGLLEGGFNVGTDLAVGFDTTGFEEWASADFAIDQVYQIFDGFYIADTLNGIDKPELRATAFLAAGAGIDLGIASGFVRGGVRGKIGLDLVDAGENEGTSDGKIRGSEIIAAFKNNPLDLFRLSGTIDAFLGARIDVNFFFFTETVYEEDFATFNLATFTLDSSGFSGTSEFGKVQGGPVSNSFVWLDANSNGIADPTEPYTISDLNGNYELLIPDGYDVGSGTVRSQGGIDQTTGLPVTMTFSNHLGEHTMTPFTSLVEQITKLQVPLSRVDFTKDQVINETDADTYLSLYEGKNLLADMTNDGKIDQRDLDLFELYYQIIGSGGYPTVQQAERLILNAEGLDPSIDLGNTSHFDNVLAEQLQGQGLLVKVDEVEALIEAMRAFLLGVSGQPFTDTALTGILTTSIEHAIAIQIIGGDLNLANPKQVFSIARDSYLFANEALINLGRPGLNVTDLDNRLSVLTKVLSTAVDAMEKLVASAHSGDELAMLVTKAKKLIEGNLAEGLYLFGQGKLNVSRLLSREFQFHATDLRRLMQVEVPTIMSQIANVTIDGDTVPDPIHFRVQNFDTADSQLKFSVASDNPTLLRAQDISIKRGATAHDFILTISPRAYASGTAFITLAVTDLTGDVVRQQFRVRVNPVEHAPVATDFVVSLVNEHSTKINPGLHALDFDGDRITPVIVDLASHGSIVQNADGTFTYQPDAGYVGLDYVTYLISDGRGGAALGRIVLDVVASVAPLVTSVTRDAGPDRVVITFNTALDAASAVKKQNYVVVSAGKDGKLGTCDDRVVAIRSISYDPITHQVTLRLARRLAPRETIRLVIHGATVKGIEGKKLDGRGKGRQGSNFVQVVKGPHPRGVK